jgi:hypothetical protein
MTTRTGARCVLEYVGDRRAWIVFIVLGLDSLPCFRSALVRRRMIRAVRVDFGASGRGPSVVRLGRFNTEFAEGRRGRGEEITRHTGGPGPKHFWPRRGGWALAGATGSGWRPDKILSANSAHPRRPLRWCEGRIGTGGTVSLRIEQVDRFHETKRIKSKGQNDRSGCYSAIQFPG